MSPINSFTFSLPTQFFFVTCRPNEGSVNYETEMAHTLLTRAAKCSEIFDNLHVRDAEVQGEGEDRDRPQRD